MNPTGNLLRYTMTPRVPRFPSRRYMNYTNIGPVRRKRNIPVFVLPESLSRYSKRFYKAGRNHCTQNRTL